MAGNYLNHLRFERDRLAKREVETRKRSKRLEAIWARSIHRTKSCEAFLVQLRAEEDRNKEKYRAAHFEHSCVRTEIAEVEEELFDLGFRGDDERDH